MMILKKIYYIIIFASCSLMLIACNLDSSNEVVLMQDYSWATTITEEIVITSNNGELLSKVVVEYNIVEDGVLYTIETTSLNSLDSGSLEAYSTVKSEVQSIEEFEFYDFETKDFAEYNVSTQSLDTTVVGVLNTTGLKNLDINSSDVSGDISVLITNTNSQLNSIIIEYISSNNNEVTISILLS